MRKILTVIALFLYTMCNIHAQSISGTVVDEHHLPIEYANIVLLGEKDSLMITHGVTDAQGNFSILCEQPRVIMRVSFVGYQSLYRPCTVTSVGVLRLYPSEILDEVEIVGKRPILTKKVDRMVYNVSNDMFANGKTGMELLEQTPRILVDKRKGSITMLGRSGVKVMLDERMLDENEVQNLLKNLHAEDIEKIEVIPIPPSKYSAEGNVGIVHVVLRKDPTIGVLGNVGIDIERSVKMNYYPTASLNYRDSKWEVRLGASSMFISGPQENTETYTYADRVLSRNEQMNMNGENYMGNALIKFKPSKRIEVGVILNGGYEKSDFKLVQKTMTNKPSDVGTLPNNPTVHTDAVHKPRKNRFSTSLYTDIVLDTLGKRVSITYNNHYKDNSVDDNYLAQINKATGKQHVEMKNTGMYTYRTHSLLADFELPYSFAQLETGASIQVVNNDSYLLLDSVGNAASTADLRTTSQYAYNEQIYGAYLMAHKNVGEKLMAKVGIRYEYTHVKGVSPAVSQATRQRYGEWFPTAFIMWTPTDDHQWSLSYARRVVRPYFEDLNPFVRYSDVNSYFKGNSDLRTQPSDNVEISYGFKGNLNVILWGNYQQRLIDYVPVIDDNGIRTESVLNNNTCRKAGFTVSYNIFLLPWWSIFAQGSVFYSQTRCTLPELNLEDRSGYGGNFNIYSNFMLNKAKTLQAGISFNQLLPSCDNLTLSRGLANLDASLSYSLFNKRLFLSLTATDIFRQNISSSKRFYSDYKLTSRTDSHLRSINLSVNWTFGKQSVNRVDKQSNDVLNGRDSK